MTEENLSNLTINYLTEEQYNNAKEAGSINNNELYMTSDDENEKDILLKTYPIGSIYINSSDTDPSILFGGTWELIKTYSGGELIAYGTGSAATPGGTATPRDENLDFANENYVKSRYFDVVNYIDNEILKVESNTFKVTTKGIVGMVKIYYEIGGSALDGTIGIWFGSYMGTLPEGVSMTSNWHGYLAPCNRGYGGGNCQRIYHVETNSNVSFPIQPKASPYGGDFKMCQDGISTVLSVEVYAKPGKRYAWKRIA